jgi:hypothetical protein
VKWYPGDDPAWLEPALGQDPERPSVPDYVLSQNVARQAESAAVNGAPQSSVVPPTAE